MAENKWRQLQSQCGTYSEKYPECSCWKDRCKTGFLQRGGGVRNKANVLLKTQIRCLLNRILQVGEFNSMHLFVQLSELRQRAGFAKSFLMFSFGAQRWFLFLRVNHVGHEQMFIHPNYASNYASHAVGRTQCLHCRVSGWHEEKATPVSLPASVSPSHSWHDNTFIQLSGLIMFHACAPALTAVLSHFTHFDPTLCHR